MPNQKFKKPLGKWITEKEEGEEIVNSFDPKTGKVERKPEKIVRDVSVIYEKSSGQINFCPEFKHVFYVSDSHLYLIKCKNCPMMRKIMPGIEYIDKDGHVRLRSNDKLIA